MPDSTWQLRTVYRQYGALSIRYEGDPSTFIGIDLLLYDREDKRGEAVAPDLFVVFGTPDKDRRSFEVGEEGRVPDFVLEVASKGTHKKDLGSKKNTYERMGVREYCVFDPQGGMHRPRLQLFRLEEGIYKRVRWWGDPDGPLAMTSETLALELRFTDDRMHFWDPQTQEYLLDHHEEHAHRMEVIARFIEESAKLVAAERRVRDLEAEVADIKERLQGEP